jgi:glutamate N-acetyltransferase/amino-acid N-acetyltransferase
MEDLHIVDEFQMAGMASGLKKNGKKDLGLIHSRRVAGVAGVFTRNLVKAAPVILDQTRIKSGRCRAIIVNSGNANCCTGEKGMQDALSMTKSVADQLGVSEDEVLVASTGVIGEPLPIDKVNDAIPHLVHSLKVDGLPDLADAIMTTDTVPKYITVQKRLKGNRYRVAAVAKGAGMIRPNMATMLCFVISDIGLNPDAMQRLLQSATDISFNRITVDGDMSTNDTVLFMANGASGVSVESSQDLNEIQKVLDDILSRLARLCVKDAEGATKLMEVRVTGAASDRAARTIADTVANSNLVKTALFGEDANWGRIIAAAGRAGVPLEPRLVDIYFDSVQLVRDGVGMGKRVEDEVSKVLTKPELTMTLDLKLGNGFSSVLTCDFSLDYVRINADYRS